MKGLLRSRFVQGLLAWLIAVYVETLIVTMRWRFENRDPVDAVMDSPQGLIALLWHGRIAQGIACRPLLKTKTRKVMISLSRDGEFIALAASKLHIPPLRGSATRSGGADKGGAKAFREAVGFIRQGGVMILTPDGPQGPREVLPIGPAQMARVADCPVFIMGLAASPAIRLKSWDEARIPLPFSRGCVVLEGPLSPPHRADEAALEATRADWQARMRAGQARADAMLYERGA